MELHKAIRCFVLPCIIFLLMPFLTQAQHFRSSNWWRNYRKEVFMGGGVSNFLGELGGRDQVGSDFIWDLELTLTKGAFNIGYRYFIESNQAIRVHYQWGILTGNDNLTKEPYRMNRNLNFRTNIHELALLYEYHFIRERPGHRYRLKKARGMKGYFLGAYGFAGVAGFYFNPRAMYQNTLVNLRPLGTEGQNLPGSDLKKYSLFQPAIPMGMGIRMAINIKWRVSLEIGYRKTFTDYIDDVSTNYANNDSIRKYGGDEAAYFANPATGSIADIRPDPEFVTAEGQQRGDPTDFDAYMFGILSIVYKIEQKRKFKRVRARRVQSSF